MNHKIPPEQEYLQLIDFYQNGGNLDSMPEEYRRLEEIFRFSSQHVERGYVTAKTLGQLIYAEFGEQYNLSKKTCYNHALNAFSYYKEVNHIDTTLIRTRLTRILFKLMDFHYEKTLPQKPVQGQKAIDLVMSKIIELNPDLRRSEIEGGQQGDVFFVMSDNAKDFPELNEVPEKRLLEMVKQFEKSHDLTEEDVETLINKDIKGLAI